MKTTLLNVIKLIAWLLVIGLLLVGGYLYWQHEKQYPSTDDAYVRANVVNIAAQISGPIVAIHTKDHATVNKGDPLFEIDPAPYRLAVKQGAATLKNTRQAIRAAGDNLRATEALVIERQAELTLTKKMTQRTLSLVKQHLASVAKGDEARSQLQVAQAALKAAQSQREEAKQALGDIGEANARIQIAKAALDQAKLNLRHTQVNAPASGTVNQFTLRRGSMITAGQPLFALIEKNDWWVNANFKETQLAHIKVGQNATIEVDMYPDHAFKGAVESISYGSGAAFSLLPAENATGNWVKVTQRFQVRIKVLNNPTHYPLRVGASSTVTIDTSWQH